MGVVNWLVTYPPEVVRGVMVTDHALPGSSEGRRFIEAMFSVKKTPPVTRTGAARRSGDGASQREPGPVVFPESWKRRMEAAASVSEPLTSIPDPFAEAPLPRWVFRDKLRNFYRQDEALARVALEVEEELRPQLLMVLFQGIDRVSHSLWGTLEPPELYPESLRPTPEEREGGAEALRRYYAYSDALIGKLAERFGPDDLVLVVSDHGFEAGVTWKILTGIHNSERSEDGVLFARGPGIRPGRVEGVSVVDVAPTVLAWLGLPVAEDMDGRVAAFLEPVAPVRRVASYDRIPIERLGQEHSGAEALYIEQLRELGYLE